MQPCYTFSNSCEVITSLGSRILCCMFIERYATLIAILYLKPEHLRYLNLVEVSDVKIARNVIFF
jgi:hypothetical protein